MSPRSLFVALVVTTTLVVPGLIGTATAPSATAGPGAKVDPRGVAVAAPLPPDAAEPQEAGLLSVSCPAAGVCFAAGYYRRQGLGLAPLVDQLSGGSWTSADLPVQPGKQGQVSGQLDEISCATPSFCVAIGQRTAGGGQPQFSQIWDGSRWTLRTLPRPSDGTKVSWVSSLSCGAADSCVAVGYYQPRMTPSKTRVPVVLTFDGSRWTAAAGPLPPGAGQGMLTSVSCTSAVDCVAAGRATVGDTEHRPLALIRSGSGWQAALLPLPASTTSEASLSSVSCVFLPPAARQWGP